VPHLRNEDRGRRFRAYHSSPDPLDAHGGVAVGIVVQYVAHLHIEELEQRRPFNGS